MVLFIHYVKKIKGVADKNGLKNATCKRTFHTVRFTFHFFVGIVTGKMGLLHFARQRNGILIGVARCEQTLAGRISVKICVNKALNFTVLESTFTILHETKFENV